MPESFKGLSKRGKRAINLNIMEFTKHFEKMLEERLIRRDWIDKTIHHADKIEDRQDGTRHYIKQINEYVNRWLRVVVNIRTNPNRAITAFFDRRLGRNKYEN